MGMAYACIYSVKYSYIPSLSLYLFHFIFCFFFFMLFTLFCSIIVGFFVLSIYFEYTQHTVRNDFIQINTNAYIAYVVSYKIKHITCTHRNTHIKNNVHFTDRYPSHSLFYARSAFSKLLCVA